MRRYDEEIPCSMPSDMSGAGDGGQPGRFLWRGRLYVVRACWRTGSSCGAWWRQRDREGLPVHVDGSGREVWRVEARAGGTRPTASMTSPTTRATALVPALESDSCPGLSRPAWSCSGSPPAGSPTRHVATTAAERYAAAHLAALRAAAAVLAVRARPAGAPGAGPRACGSCCPRWRPSWGSGRRSSPPEPSKRAAAEAGPAGGHRPRGRRPAPRRGARSSPWSRRRSGWCTSRPLAAVGCPPSPSVPDRGPCRSLRPPARRLRLLAALRRLPSRGAGRPGRRARHGHASPSPTATASTAR